MPLIRPILNVVVGLIIVGVVLWSINTYVPMAGSIKAILNFVVVIATCVGVLQAFGLWSRVVGLWSTLMNRVHLP
jgi:predicted membrane protein